MITFEAWLQSNSRNEWVLATSHGTLTLYVRRLWPEPDHARPVNKKWRERYGDIQIANMLNDSPGRGELNAFLDNQEPHFSFYIENVFNIALRDFFEKRGYRRIYRPGEIEDYPAPSYIRLNPTLADNWRLSYHPYIRDTDNDETAIVLDEERYLILYGDHRAELDGKTRNEAITYWRSKPELHGATTDEPE